MGKDHARPENGDGEAAQIVSLSQEDFAGPFADSVAVGIAPADLADRDRAADIAVFVNQMIGDCVHAEGRDVMEPLEIGCDGKPDNFGSADHVRSEQLVVG